MTPPATEAPATTPAGRGRRGDARLRARELGAGLSRGWRFLRSPSLTRRIIGSVALGLSLVLLLSAATALLTIQSDTEEAYRERLALAQALTWHVDRVLSTTRTTLERGGDAFRPEPGQPLTRAQRRELEDLALELGPYATLSAVDATGAVAWADARQAPSGLDHLAHHDGVQRALAAGAPQITETVDPTDETKASACVAVPLRDASEQVVGALMADVDPGHPSLNLLPSGVVGDEMRVHLVDARGRFLAGSNAAAEGTEGHAALLADLMASHSAGYRVHEPPASSGLETHVTAYAPVSLLPVWGVVVEQPNDLVLAAPRQLAARLVVLGVLALLAAGAVAWLDVRRVVRPLNRLTAAAQRFAAGDLDEPIHLERTDELGVLANAFETMRRRLAEWNHELERRVAARTAEVERRNRELADLNAIAETLSGTPDVGRMLDQTLERVQAITGADAGCFRVAEQDGGRLVLATERGLPAGLRDGQLDGLCARAAALDQVVVPDPATLPGDPGADGATDLRSALLVPLTAGQRRQGVLFLGSRRDDAFRETDRATLSAIGRQVGMALANAQLYAHLRAREQERAELLQRAIAAQEDERRRIAQELHDEASQALASLQLGLDQLAGGDHEPAVVRQRAALLQQVAAATLADVHRLAVELRPSVLDDLGLVAALARYLEEGRQRWKIPVGFAAVGVEGVSLLPAAATAVYRIVQGALTNALQHARPRHVSVLLQRRDEDLVVVVEDDGLGFDLAAVRAAPLEQRLGLAGMEERAALVGAALTIETEPDAGTSVFLRLPLAGNTTEEVAAHAAAGAG